MSWAVPDPETMRRITFHLQRPDWHVRAPFTHDGTDGKWHACNGTTDLAAGSLAALLDELDWFHAT